MLGKVEANFDEYLSFEGMYMRGSFQMMATLINDIPEENTRQRFQHAISHKKRFQNFNRFCLTVRVAAAMVCI